MLPMNIMKKFKLSFWLKITNIYLIRSQLIANNLSFYQDDLRIKIIKTKYVYSQELSVVVENIYLCFSERAKLISSKYIMKEKNRKTRQIKQTPGYLNGNKDILNIIQASDKFSSINFFNHKRVLKSYISVILTQTKVPEHLPEIISSYL
jgi:hypothetical protein